MKAYRIISILPEAVMITVASALLLAGCAKETAQNIADEQLVEYSIQAKVDWPVTEAEDGTKVTLGVDGKTPAWENGDQIRVLDADKKPVGKDGGFFTYDTSSSKFTGKVKVGQTPKYAIYPASAATVSGDAAVTAGTLVASTGDDAGTIKGAVMLGSSSDGTTFTFTNACAVLKFNTGDYGKTDGDPAIKSVKVSATYGSTATPVAGAFTIDWTNRSISKASSSAVNELTVTLPSALQTINKDIYIPIFPLPMESSTAPSMAFEFTNAGAGVAEVSYDFSAAIAANTLKTLGTAQGLNFLVPPPSSEFWVDLGMVSDNGKKLYVAKYDVADYDPETGIATFQTDGAQGKIFPYQSSEYDFRNVESEDGQACRVISVNELYSFAIPNNFDFSNAGGVSTLTSKMEGACKGSTVTFADGYRLVGAKELPDHTMIHCDRYRAQHFRSHLAPDYFFEYNQDFSHSDGSVRLVCETNEEVPSPSSLRAYASMGGPSGYRHSFASSTIVDDGSTYIFPDLVGIAWLRPVIIYSNNLEYHNYDALPNKYLIDGSSSSGVAPVYYEPHTYSITYYDPSKSVSGISVTLSIPY